MSVLKNKRSKLENNFQLDALTFTLLNYSIKYLNSTKVIVMRNLLEQNQIK